MKVHAVRFGGFQYVLCIRRVYNFNIYSLKPVFFFEMVQVDHN